MKMARHKYSKSVDSENAAKAVCTDMPISLKQSVEICNLLRGKKLSRAERILNDVMQFKEAVPYRRFNAGAGHKPGIGPGRYPVKACKYILNVLLSAKANADNLGLDLSSLEVAHICAQAGASRYKGGRQRGRVAKCCAVEVILEGKADSKKKKAKPEKDEKKALIKSEPAGDSAAKDKPAKSDGVKSQNKSAKSAVKTSKPVEKAGGAKND